MQHPYKKYAKIKVFMFPVFCKIGGKISTTKKTCIITDKFKHPEKYKLKIGQSFESVNVLAEYTGKSNVTLAQWRSKGWIE